MKKISFFILLTVFALLLNGYSQDKEITLESIFLKPEFSSVAVTEFKSMSDGIHYSLLEDDMSISGYDYETGKFFKTLLDGKDFKKASGKDKITISSYELSADETKILVSTDVEKVYRRSVISNYYVWNTSNKSLTLITKRGKVQLAKLSPDGSNVAFVMNNNLFIYDLNTGKETQITTDGERTKIINGTTDWVYEEELGLTDGFEWSPDSKKIAYMRFDESNVKEFDLIFYGDLYPNVSKYKYPKAGENNSIVTIHVYDLKEKKTVKCDAGNNPDVYLARIKWTPVENILSVVRLSRLQNKEDILFTDALTGASRVVYSEENRYFLKETYELTFLKDGRFFHISDKDGFAHVYLHDKSGKIISQVTKGNFEINELKGIDEKKELVYYTAFESSQYNRDVFSVKLDGTDKKKISPNDGYNSAYFSSNFTYYVISNSDANNPAVRTLYNSDGTEIKVISDNKKLKAKLKEYNLSKKEFFSFRTSDGVDLNGWIMKPVNLDESKKYPVLMYVYGGPGSQSVINSWGNSDYMWYQMLCTKGYVIACVDGRGTGARGSEFEKQIYGKMGKLELNDQIEAAKYLGSLNFVDKDRIGIWGWSFGGYMASLCITAGADYFKTAIAVAPVTNFRYYDNIYSERYLGLPKDNPGGYDEYSPQNYADKLKGKFLVVHGAVDDNVHLQNTMELVNELVKANKQFEMQIYTNKNHNISGGNTRYHLYKRMTEFILNNL